MARKPKNQSELKIETKSEVMPLKVEITFPSISDLRQAILTDNDGNLVVALQFKAKVDQFEIFRLVNLLKQPHSGLYAIIGSPQTVMDFKFDAKELRFEIFKAAAQIAAGDKKKAAAETAQVQDQAAAAAAKVTPPAQVKGPGNPTGKVFVDITTNFIETDAKPFGLFANYRNGEGKDKSAAGRGTSAAEAALFLLGQVDIIPTDRKVEPFEAIKYLTEGHGTDALCLALADVIKTNSFDPLSKAQGAAGPPAQAESKKRGRKSTGEDSTKGA